MSYFCGFIDIHSQLSFSQKNIILDSMLQSLIQKSPPKPSYYLKKEFAICFPQNNLQSTGIPTENQINEKQPIFSIIEGNIFNTDYLRNYKATNNNSPINYTHSNFIQDLYKKFNIQYALHLDGEFRNLICDIDNHLLLLSTDMLGTKPIFYYINNDYFIFASEIKFILASKLFLPEINFAGVNDFFTFGYVPHPETMFKNIMQVEPGSTIQIEFNKIKKHNYWSFNYNIEGYHPEEYYIHTFMELLQKAIQKRIKNHTHISAYLSGGIDSSGICSLLSEKFDIPFKAITIGFEEPSFNEIPYAEIIAKKHCIDWTSKVIRPGDILPLFEKMTYDLDSPFKDSSIFPSYFAAKAASDYSNTVLTGDGPDQLMLGSDQHKNFQLAIDSDNCFKKLIRKAGLKHIFENIPISISADNYLDKIKRKLYFTSIPFEEKFYKNNMISLLLKRYLYSYDFMEVNKGFSPYRNIIAKMQKVRDRPELEQYLFYDIYFYLHDDLIPKVERTCAVNKIKPSSPYLDKDLLLFIQTIPTKYRLNGQESKYLMKKAFAELMPHEALYRQKKGFSIPKDEWYLSQIKGYICEILFDQKTLDRNYFDKNRLKILLERYFSGKSSYYSCSSTLINSMVTLELWHRIFFESKAWSR